MFKLRSPRQFWPSASANEFELEAVSACKRIVHELLSDAVGSAMSQRMFVVLFVEEAAQFFADLEHLAIGLVAEFAEIFAVECGERVL